MKIGVAVIAFDRPDYFKHTIKSLEAQNYDADYHLFQDGCISKFTGLAMADQNNLNHCTQLFLKSSLPNKVEHVRDANVGNAINQYEAICYMAEHYDYFFVVEDDVILGRDYFAVCLAMIPLLGIYFSCNAGFIRHCPLEDISTCIDRVLKVKTHWWAELYSANNWRKVQPYFMEYYNLVKNHEYRDRPHELIFNLYKHHGCPVKESSQDGGRDFAIYLAGMERITTVVNRGINIGKVGLHFTPDQYERMGLGNQLPYEHSEPLCYNL